jgi:hypothetical protein
MRRSKPAHEFTAHGQMLDHAHDCELGCRTAAIPCTGLGNYGLGMGEKNCTLARDLL